ncbi:hypothetical protein ACLOJK_018217 [Asimina triloba]
MRKMGQRHKQSYGTAPLSRSKHDDGGVCACVTETLKMAKDNGRNDWYLDLIIIKHIDCRIILFN